MERELSDNERAIEALSQEETDAADATERLSQEIARQEDALAGMKRAYSNAVLQYGKGSSEAKELEGRISRLSLELRENRERMKDAGDVAEDRIGSKLKLELVALVNYPRPGGSPARVVEQSYKALPAGNKGALTFVGDKISLPGYSRLKPKLGGNEQAGKDTYSGTPLQGWVL